MNEYNKEYANRMCAIATVGTSVLTNQEYFKFDDIQFVLKRKRSNKGVSFNNGKVSFEDEKTLSLYESMYNLFYIKDFNLSKDFNSSAELATLFKFIEEDAMKYFKPNQYEILESLKDYADSFYNESKDVIKKTNGMFIHDVDYEHYIKTIKDLTNISSDDTKDSFKKYIRETYMELNNTNYTEEQKEIRNWIGKFLLDIISREWPSFIKKDVDIYLLATDSFLGMLSAEILYNLLSNQRLVVQKDNLKLTYVLNGNVTKEKSISLIKHLNVEDSAMFKTYGVNNFFKQLDSILKQYKNHICKIMYFVTGGHKLVVPFLTLHSYLNAIESYYIFYEDHASLFRIPKISVSLDEELTQKYRSLLRRFTKKHKYISLTSDNKEEYSFMQQQGLVLIDEENSRVCLSYLGQMFKDTISQLEVKDQQFGAVFERYIYSELIRSKKAAFDKYLPNSTRGNIYTDVHVYDGGIIEGELDLLFVNSKGEYIIGEIKSLGAAIKLEDQIIKYIKFMDDRLNKNSKYSFKNKELYDALKIPKSINIFLVGDFIDVKYLELKLEGFYAKLLKTFNDTKNKSNHEVIKNLNLRLTRVDLSISTTKSKGDKLKYSDYNFSKKIWQPVYDFDKDVHKLEMIDLVSKKEKNDNQLAIPKVPLKENVYSITTLEECLSNEQINIDFTKSFNEMKSILSSNKQILVSESKIDNNVIQCYKMTLEQFYYYGRVIQKYESNSSLLKEYYYLNKDSIQLLNNKGKKVTLVDSSRVTRIERRCIFLLNTKK